MSIDRARWETRHAAAPGRMDSPSALLLRFLPSLPRGRALDLACGSGRHSLALARSGFTVDAIDIASTALTGLQAIARREGLAVSPIQADLETYPLPRDRYSVVVNVRYLQRDLFDAIRGALLPGGVAIFETFLREQAQLGHPRNPAYLLDRGELRARFAGFEILEEAEGLMETDGGACYLARLVARRPGASD